MQLNLSLGIVWEDDPKARVIVTDMHDTIMFHPPAHDNTVAYEDLTVKNNLTAIRIFIAAYLLDSLLEFDYIVPPLDSVEIASRALDPLRLSKDYISPTLIPDSDLISTFKRQSDFNVNAMLQSEEIARRFFRWKELVQEFPRPDIGPGQIILVTANKVDHWLDSIKTLRPLYRFEPGELPQSTRDFLISAKRPIDDTAKAITQDDEHRFRIEILEILTPESGSEICTTYKCRLISVDDEDSLGSSSLLVVKLFDDRWLPMDQMEDMENNKSPFSNLWFSDLNTAEEQVLNEHLAYQTLEYVQGSLIPHYYGGHLV